MKARSSAPAEIVTGGFVKKKSFVSNDIGAKKNVTLGLLCIANFFLLPMYLFPSGGFQLVDISIILTAIVIFFQNKLPHNFNKKLIYGLLPFCIWVFLINLIYFTIYQQRNEIRWTLALIYGFFQLFVFSLLFLNLINNKKLGYIYVALIFSIIGCFVAKGYAEEGRATLSFNNPNQLAYYAAILFSYTILLIQYKIDNNIKTGYYLIIDILFIIVVHFFILISFSRAGMIVVLFLDLCLLFNMKNNKYVFPIFFMFITISGLVLIFNKDYVQKRLGARAPDQLVYKDSLKDRVLKPLEQLRGINILIGSGAGGHGRIIEQKGSISQTISTIEVHNTFGDILRSYGFIGLILFLYWYFNVIWQGRKIKNGLWVMVAIFAFNNAHIGIRFRSFWILMAFFIVLIYLKQTSEDNASQAGQTKHIP